MLCVLPRRDILAIFQDSGVLDPYAVPKVGDRHHSGTGILHQRGKIGGCEVDCYTLFGECMQAVTSVASSTPSLHFPPKPCS